MPLLASHCLCFDFAFFFHSISFSLFYLQFFDNFFVIDFVLFLFWLRLRFPFWYICTLLTFYIQNFLSYFVGVMLFLFRFPFCFLFLFTWPMFHFQISFSYSFGFIWLLNLLLIILLMFHFHAFLHRRVPVISNSVPFPTRSSHILHAIWATLNCVYTLRMSVCL